MPAPVAGHGDREAAVDQLGVHEVPQIGDAGLGDPQLFAQPPVPPGGRRRAPGSRAIRLLGEDEGVFGQTTAEGQGNGLQPLPLHADECHGPFVDVDVAGSAGLRRRLLDPAAGAPDVVPAQLDGAPGDVDVGEADGVQLAPPAAGDGRQPDEQREGRLDVGRRDQQLPDALHRGRLRLPLGHRRQLDIRGRVVVDPPPPPGGVERLGQDPVDVAEGLGAEEGAVAPQAGDAPGVELLDDLGVLLEPPERLVSQRPQVLGVVAERLLSRRRQVRDVDDDDLVEEVAEGDRRALVTPGGHLGLDPVQLILDRSRLDRERRLDPPPGHRVAGTRPDTDLVAPNLDVAGPPGPPRRRLRGGDRRRRQSVAHEVLRAHAEPVAAPLADLALRPGPSAEEPRHAVGELRPAVDLDPAEAPGAGLALPFPAGCAPGHFPPEPLVEAHPIDLESCNAKL